MIYKKIPFFIFSFITILICFNGVLNHSAILGKNINLPEISNKMVNYMNDRNINWENIGDLKNRDFKQRFKYRWPFKNIENKFYENIKIFSNLSNKHYALIYYSIIIFLGFVFTFKSSEIFLDFNKEFSKYLFLLFFLSLYLFIEIISSMSETFSYVEFLCISICLFGALNKNLIIFFLGLLMAIANRESGMAYSILYPLINYKIYKLHNNILILISGPLIFIILNFDIIVFFPYFIIFGGIEERPTFTNLYSIYSMSKGELISSILIYIIYFTPLIIVNIKNYLKFKLLWPICTLIILIFITIIGSFFGNFRLFLIFIPLYIVSFSLYYKHRFLFNIG